MAVTAASMEPGLSILQAAGKSATLRLPNELFRFRFGSNAAGEMDSNVFRLHIDPIGTAAPDEIWVTNSAVRNANVGNFAVAESDDYLAAHIEIELDEAVDFRDLTTRVYRELLQVVRDRGYPNLIRAWNYFPDINTGDGDLEMYRQFTAGRIVAFDEFGYEFDALPAGTAIGTDAGTPFTISALAARDRCQMIENPRQISAYRYPREYGPTSPSFSRAVVVANGSGCQILMSGTASIVGHQSMHPDDPAGQMTETLCNLDELIQHACIETQVSNASSRILVNGYQRVYVRQPAQLPQIRKVLCDYLEDDSGLIFFRGDICRQELLVEIEAAGSL